MKQALTAAVIALALSACAMTPEESAQSWQRGAEVLNNALQQRQQHQQELRTLYLQGKPVSCYTTGYGYTATTTCY